MATCPLVPLEPSPEMRRRRPRNLAPSLIGTADSIPFDDGAFDATMAILTIHHWANRKQCLEELRRVTRERIVIMTFDPDAPTEFWMKRYAPELDEIERKRYGSIRSITDVLGECEILPIAIPRDCTDGFQDAFYARPEAFLENSVRRSQSAWSFIPDGAEERIVRSIGDDLRSGAWDEKYRHLRNRETINCQLRLAIEVCRLKDTAQNATLLSLMLDPNRKCFSQESIRRKPIKKSLEVVGTDSSYVTQP